jgi:hypothetical protein
MKFASVFISADKKKYIVVGSRIMVANRRLAHRETAARVIPLLLHVPFP